MNYEVYYKFQLKVSLTLNLMEKIQKNNLFSQIVRDNKKWDQYNDPKYLKNVRCLSYHFQHMLDDTLPKFKNDNEYSKILKELKKCEKALFTLNDYFEKYERELDMPKVNLYSYNFKKN
jgi:hypothetical protein